VGDKKDALAVRHTNDTGGFHCWIFQKWTCYRRL